LNIICIALITSNTVAQSKPQPFLARLSDKQATLLRYEQPPSAPPTLTPEEQAEQAQQRADCLKLAVKNPTIACK
jgi:hypothetical protein